MTGTSKSALRSLSAACVALLASTSAQADDWPCFLGPKGNATSDETALNFGWGEAGPAESWSHEIGEGFGGVAIVDGRVYLLDRIPGERDVMRCWELDSGEEVWTTEWEAEGRLPYAGSRQVPWVTEDLVYGVSGFGMVYCVDRESGEEEWTLSLQEDYDAPLPMFGFALSPVVWEEILILAPMSEECGLLGLDRFTGDEIWQTAEVGGSHSTPTLMEIAGRTQVLFLSSRMPEIGGGSLFGGRRDEERPSGPPTGEGVLTALDPESGEVQWSSNQFFCSLPIPCPIKVDDDHLFLTAGYTAGSLLLKLDRAEEPWTTQELFRSTRGAQIHQPILVGEHLYVLVNENDNDPRPRRREGGLMCIDLEGNEQWRTGDQPFFGRGNMMLAAGKLIIQDGHSGVLRIVEPDPKEYRMVAEANLFGNDGRRDHQMWAPMALSEGRLVLRSQDELKCLDLRPESGRP